MVVYEDEVLDYFAGLVAGDGDLYYRESKGEYRIRVSDACRRFLETVASLLSSTLGVKASVYCRESPRCCELRVYSKWLYFEIVERIKHRLRKPTIAFVRGLIDAEGGLNRSTNRVVRLHFTNTDPKIVEAVTKVFQDLGIKHYVCKSGNKYKVYVQGWENVDKVIQAIRPMHPKIIEKYLEFSRKHRKQPNHVQ